MKNYTKETLRIFWTHVRHYNGLVFLVALSVLIAEGTGLYKPILYKKLLDSLSQPAETTLYSLSLIVITIFAINSLAWLFWRIATFLDSYLASNVMSDLLNTCFKVIHRHSYSFFNNNFVGSLVRKVTRYPKAYETISDQLFWQLGRVVFIIIVTLSVLATRSPMLSLILLIWIIVYVIVNYQFTKYKLKYDVTRAEADSAVSGGLADTITNATNLKLFGTFNFELKGFTKLTTNLTYLRKLTWDLESILGAIQGAFMAVLEFIVMYVSIPLWKEGVLTVGDFALIQAYLVQVFDNLWEVGRNIRKIYEHLADADEMTRVMLDSPEILDIPAAKALQVDKGAITFNDVTFGYHANRVVYKQFNLAIKPGERVAFIGPSGGGKSTIVKLLFRFFDIRKGAITIDGQNIAEVTQESLRRQIALVPQEPILFHRSLMENIRYARPDSSDEEVIAAAKLAHCHEFIDSFPEKYETFVGERGVKLSGGERQRVAIARAILMNAPILVLDEATSSLDSESERYIQQALGELMKEKTVIVIAHRLSTIMQMDRIVVIEKGKITEQGTHEKLLKAKQGTYQKLWEIQAGSFASE